MKRTPVIVIGVHIILFFSMMLFAPKKKVEKKPLIVKTVVQAPPPKAPPKAPVVETKAPIATPAKIQKAVAKKTPPKKPVQKKPVRNTQPVQRQPQIPAHLLHQLQESIAKIDQNSHKESSKNNPKTPIAIPTLSIERGSGEDQAAYANALVACLKRNLVLPEVGEVKIELVLQSSGSLKGFRVLSSQSERNKRFLETELGKIRYPSFTGSLKSEKEHPFVITFSNH